MRRATKSGLGTTVSKLVLGMCRLFGAGASPPLSCPIRGSWFVGWLAGLLHYSVYRREHVLPRRVNCSGEDWKLTVPSVILRDERRVPADKFQGRRKFSNNAVPLVQYASLHIACPFSLYPGQPMEIQTRNEIGGD